MSEIRTGGGSSLGGDVDARGDFIGRDRVNNYMSLDRDDRWRQVVYDIDRLERELDLLKNHISRIVNLVSIFLIIGLFLTVWSAYQIDQTNHQLQTMSRDVERIANVIYQIVPYQTTPRILPYSFPEPTSTPYLAPGPTE